MRSPAAASRSRRIERLAWVASAVLTVGCRYREPDPGPAYYASAIELALRSGNLDLAQSVRARARQRQPGNGAVLWWSATLSQMLWEHERALAELHGVLASPDRGGLTESECRGQIGGLLFRMGNYGESIEYLDAVEEGPDAGRRRAFARLARELPYFRSQVGALATELPLVQGSLPELVCSIGDKRRSFALDSGTSMTTLSRSMAEELEVSPIIPVGMTTHDNGETYSVSVGVLRQFALGDVQLGSIPVLVVADHRLTLRDMFGGAEARLDGVVGMDILSIFRTTIDPERQSVVLDVPRDLPPENSVRCLWLSDRWIVPVDIEGRQLWFILDTGASHSSLTEEGLEALPSGAARVTKTHRRVRSAGGTSVAVREITNLVVRVSDTRFSGVPLPVVPRATAGLFPIHGVLGADLLLLCRVTLVGGRLRLETGG